MSAAEMLMALMARGCRACSERIRVLATLVLLLNQFLQCPYIGVWPEWFSIELLLV